ncbi:MAG: AsmA family protein [Deltaproteobacteria bacterium]|nr:AsmA family protein [Deltaproteobacteria bacterium]
MSNSIRWIKAVLLVLVGTIVLCVVLLTILISTLQDDHYRWIVTRAARYFAGLDVAIEGPFAVELSSEPLITASKIRITHISDPAPSTADIGRLEIKFALNSLLYGTVLIRHLLIDDATVSIVDRSEADDSRTEEKPSHVVIPVLESVTLQNVRLTLLDEHKSEVVRLLLANLSLNDVGDEGPLYVKADGTLNSGEFKIDGQLGSLTDILTNEKPYPVDVRGMVEGLKLTMSGTVDDPVHGQGLNIRASGEHVEMADMLRLFWEEIPNIGSLKFEALITGDVAAPHVSSLDLRISDDSELEFSAKGSMGDMLTGNNTSMQVSGSCTGKDILQMLLPEGLPQIHRLEGDLLIRDGEDVYVVEALKLTGSNEQGTTIKAEGTMGFSRAIGKVPAFRELDLNCRLSSPTTESAKFPAVDFLPELGAMSATGRVRLSGDLLRFEDLAVHSSHAQGLQVDTTGTLRISLDEAKDTPVQIDFKASVAAPNMGAAKPLLGKVYLSRAGPLRGEGRITGTSEALSVEDLSITVGESGPVRARWQGRIGRVPLSSGELPSDVDIVGAIDADEASALASLAAISLPNLGPLKTTLRIVEQGGVYRFKDIQLSMGSQESLWLKGAGSFDLVTKDGSVSLSGLDAEVAASAPSLASIPGAADLDLPDLRPLKLTAHIIDPDGRMDILDVKEFTFDAGTEEDAFLRIQGQGSGLRSSDQRVLEASFKTSSKPWVIKILEGSAPGNHVVEGKLKVAGTPKHIRIHKLEVGTTGPNRLYLEADGTVKEIDGMHELEGHIASGASHISVLESLLGIDVPPFGAPLLEGQITGNTKKASFKGMVRLGSSRFRTTLSHSLTKKRPRVTAKMVATTVHLSDLGFYPERAEDLPSESKSESKPDRRLLSDTPLSFHALKAIDLSASVDIDKLRGEGFVLNKLDFDMSLRDGKLQVAPARVTYKSGFASIDFTIDAVGSKPEMALKVTAEDVDIEALLTHIHERPFLKGQLNLVVDLQSAGNSPREIAAALGGEIGLAVEKGKIKRAFEFMGADTVGFLSGILSQREYNDLNCMALRFIFEEGVGRSEIIYIDIPDMYVRGGGHIDLHTETMKMVLQPKPKKGLRGMTSAVTIDGPIADPKVRKLPFREAAKLYGEIFMPVVFFPARALGYLWYLIRKDKEAESPCLHVIPQDNSSGAVR